MNANFWKTAEGKVLLAPMPPEVIPGSHFGPQLQAYIPHQYHHQRVTQPLLLEQLRQLGVDISAGQLNRILTEGKDIFHQEKKEILQAGLERPEVPLHNNASESVIREYVTKRKISGSTRSAAGRRCRDTFASLKKTCRALNVNFWEYLQDRLRGRGLMPPLPNLIRQRAKESCPGKVQAAPA